MAYDEVMLELVRETLIVSLKIAAPILLAGVLVGLVISVLQSVTSIQDQSLTFVPKIVVMLLVAVVLLPWIVIRLAAFATAMFRLM
ncbi:MAG: flagellar biosynthetic protein FliQ [Phycisphaerae bacterium]|nr:flagellar biosynthetic protein FliQ [Phycisphaerae bacterium]